MQRVVSAVVAGFALAGVANGSITSRARTAGMPMMPLEALVPATASASDEVYCYGLYDPSVACPIVAATFDQFIDHNNHELGTFKQRYWYNAEFYAGPNSPLVLVAPGEYAADRMVWYTTNYTLSGVYAQELQGAAVIMEHRYWGQSSPYDKMTTKNLQLLTLDQAIQDIVHFAQAVELPFTHNTTSPEKSPWVLVGGSYPGALTAWINKLAPGTFWAYHASSAVVQPIADYWQYFEPVEQAMPRNCSKDMKLAIKQLDRILDSRDDAGKTALKAKFGLASLTDDDFGGALTAGLSSWQSTIFYSSKADQKLFNMCDYMEGVGDGNKNNSVIPGEEGVGGCKALRGLAQWFREVEVPGSCTIYDYWATDKTTIACWDTHNITSPFYTDRSPTNGWDLQWTWMCCNEPFQQWQAYSPGDTGLVSKYFTTQSVRDQCGRFFPEEDGLTYGLNSGRTTEQIVDKTTGWENIHTTRLIYVNGELDPWKQESVSSTNRPGGPLQSTDDVPVFVVKGGSHCSDLVMRDGYSNEDLLTQMGEMIYYIEKWVNEFYVEKGIKRP